MLGNACACVKLRVDNHTHGLKAQLIDHLGPILNRYGLKAQLIALGSCPSCTDMKKGSVTRVTPNISTYSRLSLCPSNMCNEFFIE